MPVRLTVVAADDPQCAVVASTSFWRLGGGACQWSTVALAFVSIVNHGRDNRSFSCSLHYFGPCLNKRYTRNILALEIWFGE
jgi:hypothetical protein